MSSNRDRMQSMGVAFVAVLAVLSAGTSAHAQSFIRVPYDCFKCWARIAPVGVAMRQTPPMAWHYVVPMAAMGVVNGSPDVAFGVVRSCVNCVSGIVASLPPFIDSLPNGSRGPEVAPLLPSPAMQTTPGYPYPVAPQFVPPNGRPFGPPGPWVEPRRMSGPNGGFQGGRDGRTVMFPPPGYAGTPGFYAVGAPSVRIDTPRGVPVGAPVGAPVGGAMPGAAFRGESLGGGADRRTPGSGPTPSGEVPESHASAWDHGGHYLGTVALDGLEIHSGPAGGHPAEAAAAGAGEGGGDSGGDSGGGDDSGHEGGGHEGGGHEGGDE
jgi:hypothetical protein